MPAASSVQRRAIQVPRVGRRRQRTVVVWGQLEPGSPRQRGVGERRADRGRGRRQARHQALPDGARRRLRADRLEQQAARRGEGRQLRAAGRAGGGMGLDQHAVGDVRLSGGDGEQRLFRRMHR